MMRITRRVLTIRGREGGRGSALSEAINSMNITTREIMTSVKSNLPYKAKVRLCALNLQADGVGVGVVLIPTVVEILAS